MMLLLVGDVRPQRFDMAWAGGKRAVAILPMEIVEVRALGLHPFRRLTFEFLDQIGDGDDTAESAKDMNVIGDTADAEDRTIKGVASAAEVMVHFVANGANL